MKRLVWPILALLIVTTVSGCGVNQSPTAYIDSITPAEVTSGETVAFNGHGTDPDGTVVAYRWRSSLDDDLSASASFDTSSLSEGAHTVYFKVQDNNGAWSEEVSSTVVVSGAAAPPPVIDTFEAIPGSIDQGESSTLSWSVSGGAGATIDHGIGNVALSGTRVVSPDMTTVYTLTASNGAGSATATAQVVVSAPSPSPPAGLPVINSFTANPWFMPAGDSSTLSWNVSGADTVNIDHGIGDVGSSGSTSVSPAVPTNYTLTASNAFGWSSVTIQVVIIGGQAGPPVINSFLALPQVAPIPTPVNLQWVVTDATEVTITPGLGAVDPIGAVTLPPVLGTIAYTLTATNQAGSVEQTRVVTRIAP